jgi:fructose/tagatose bisphosphate aldolase
VEGVSKFNIFTEYNMALSNAMAASLATGNKGGLKVLCDSKEACKELVKHKIRTVNPKGLRVI